MIGLFGPHAIGKTTAVERWVDRYCSVGLVGVFCDNQRLYDGQATTREVGWQGSTAQKHEMLRKKREQPGIFVLEGCASYGTQLVRGFEKTDWVIHVHCSAARLRELIQDRCERKGREYNATYWADRADYECFRRMDNCLRKHLSPNKITTFRVENLEQDWLAVDKYFGKLFRQLRNQMVRARARR